MPSQARMGCSALLEELRRHLTLGLHSNNSVSPDPVLSRSNLRFRVVAGDHNIYQSEGTEQILEVSSIHIHPNWNSNNVAAGYDIALLRLSGSFTLNNYVKLAVLPSQGTVLSNNYPCYITGWGLTRTNGQLSSVLLQAYLPVVSYSTCSSFTYWGSTVKNTMICAGGDGVHSGCQEAMPSQARMGCSALLEELRQYLILGLH
ncbi:UNVERIFIED_CONTAM: hypothetical protein H355_003586, partial [Colinus virginianus]